MKVSFYHFNLLNLFITLMPSQKSNFMKICLQYYINSRQNNKKNSPLNFFSFFSLFNPLDLSLANFHNSLFNQSWYPISDIMIDKYCFLKFFLQFFCQVTSSFVTKEKKMLISLVITFKLIRFILQLYDVIVLLILTILLSGKRLHLSPYLEGLVEGNRRRSHRRPTRKRRRWNWWGWFG